ncbi:nicotinate-nicotinamide nucleotide adenylyltransferase [Oligoflexus tunisiensis]|uniref:nicotinate-nicotinamide nucleotide adenylyltransferase n=1 Tax=Oligoflexus tunisiensis TaxID=708132 RepID=UPI000B02EB16|nr:nicotinate-nicotinamide nucleotide adenylyltransferase [Oligoflexus tunisiensis]
MASEPQERSRPSVIFYGGTFDPPHVGHQRVVERTCARFPGSCVWISVGPAPAGAAQQHKAPGATFEQRLAMCRLNFANVIQKGGALLTDVETKLPAPNYTVQTLRHCQQHFSGETWALLIGQDQLEQFAAWREPLEILRMADLVVVSRGQDRSLTDALQTLAAKLGLHLDALEPERLRWRELGTSVYLLPGSVSDAASRDVRKDPSALLKKGWLVPDVAAYIQQHGIYTK